MSRNIFILLSLLFISSCSNNDENKILSCRYEKDDVISIVDITYDSTGVEMFFMYIENKVFIGNVEATEDQLKEDCELYTDVLGVSCLASIEEEYYIYTLEYDLSKATDEFLKKDNFLKSDYETYKKDLENNEYICN